MLSFYCILFDRKISNSIRLFKNLEKKFGNCLCNILCTKWMYARKFKKNQALLPVMSSVLVFNFFNFICLIVQNFLLSAH